MTFFTVFVNCLQKFFAIRSTLSAHFHTSLIQALEIETLKILKINDLWNWLQRNTVALMIKLNKWNQDGHVFSHVLWYLGKTSDEKGSEMCKVLTGGDWCCHLARYCFLFLNIINFFHKVTIKMFMWICLRNLLSL